MTLNMNRRFVTLGLATAASFGTTGFAQETETKTEIEIQDMVLGAEDAPVTLTEYASYTCPHCANFHSNVFKKIRADFIDTGKVKFIFREVYFDRLGLWAGMLARCDGPQKYFGISDMLLSKQSEWTRGDDGAAIAENLYKIGRIAGLNNDAMEACLQDREMAEALVERFKETSEEDGVNSTPTLFINGENIGNKGYEELSKLLIEAGAV